jgi:hypothetical protein
MHVQAARQHVLCMRLALIGGRGARRGSSKGRCRSSSNTSIIRLLSA